jgi:hypothetical protein
MEEQKLLELDLSSSPREVIELLIEDVSDPSVFEEIVKANMNRPEILKLLLDTPSTPESVRKQAAEVLQVPARSPREIEKVKKPPEMRSQTIYQKIQGLKFSDKRLLALRGGRDVRSVLIKDPNKELSLTVLENPKITETEIELIAKSKTSSDEAIRKIIKKREWMKSYPIILAIVSNPKTPAGIGISLLSGLKTKDLSSLEKNKNIPEAIRSAAKTLLRGRKGL